MIKVIVNNSTSKILGLNTDQFKKVRNTLSYLETNTGSSYKFKGKMIFTSTRKYLITPQGLFPTGLLPRLKAFLDKNNIEAEWVDVRVKPISSKTLQDALQLKLEHTPYVDQQAAVDSLINDNDGRGIIVAPTGAGKSTICAMIIGALKVKSLVVVPSLELKTQLTTSLKKQFGANSVGPMGKDGSTPYPISVENVDALDPKIRPTGVNLLILDEFHGSATTTYRHLNQKVWGDIYYRCGLTATPYRNKDTEKILLESVLSKIVYRITYRTAVERGYIVPVQAFYYELPKIKPKGNTRSYQAMNSELIINREDKNQLIVDLICNLEEAGESTLVLLKEIKHGEIIKQMLLAKGKNIAFANGENPDNRILLLEFNLMERKTLIATGVLGMGVDTKPCSFVILAAGGKSKPQLVQNIGRCLRTYPGKEIGTVILFLDKSHAWMDKHFKSVVHSLKEEYGIDVIKLV